MSSVFDNVDYLYAERLKGKRVTLTIKEVVSGVEFFCAQSNKKEKGIDVVFEETFKGTDRHMKLVVELLRKVEPDGGRIARFRPDRLSPYADLGIIPVVFLSDVGNLWHLKAAHLRAVDLRRLFDVRVVPQ